MSNRTVQTIPEPTEDIPSLRRTALATKEIVETLTGQRGQDEYVPTNHGPMKTGLLDKAVTWRDLVDLGIVRPEKVPQSVGNRRIVT